MKKMYDGIS